MGYELQGPMAHWIKYSASHQRTGSAVVTRQCVQRNSAEPLVALEFIAWLGFFPPQAGHTEDSIKETSQIRLWKVKSTVAGIETARRRESFSGKSQNFCSQLCCDWELRLGSDPDLALTSSCTEIRTHPSTES